MMDTTMATCAVASGVADVSSEPAADAERVTQAVLNTLVTCGELRGDWVHVTLPDYEGWMHTNDLAEPAVKGFTRVGAECATPLDLVAVIAVTHTPLYSDESAQEQLLTAYLSTVLPLLDTTQDTYLQVALPDERVAWITRSAVSVQRQSQPYPETPLHEITEYARSFLGVPYLWGGGTYEGIDCSALVQLCYRMGGYTLPRDADQQHDALSHSIERADMQEGDLLFFGRKSITHVALALNQKEYIHAEGQDYNRVTINSLDATDTHYDQRLADLLVTVKRVVS